MFAARPRPHRPVRASSAPADIDAARKLCRAGLRDIDGAAEWLGTSRRDVEELIRLGAIWSFTPRGRNKVRIPVKELQRYAAELMMEAIHAS